MVTQNRTLPNVPDVPKLLAPKHRVVHTFRRTVNRGTVTADAAGVGASLEFSLADDPSTSDLTSLFDQYRILQVVVRFIPVTLVFGASTSATSFPSLLTAIDYDDNVAPASAQVMRQYGTCQTTSVNTYVERTLNPQAALSAYQGTFTAYSAAPRSQWFDCAFPSVEFYGLKWFTTPVSVVSGSYILFNIECEYVMQFRDQM